MTYRCDHGVDRDRNLCEICDAAKIQEDRDDEHAAVVEELSGEIERLTDELGRTHHLLGQIVGEIESDIKLDTIPRLRAERDNARAAIAPARALLPWVQGLLDHPDRVNSRDEATLMVGGGIEMGVLRRFRNAIRDA